MLLQIYFTHHSDKEKVRYKHLIQINTTTLPNVFPKLFSSYVFGERVQGFYRIKYSLLNPADGSLQLVKDGVNGSVS